MFDVMQERIDVRDEHCMQRSAISVCVLCVIAHNLP